MKKVIILSMVIVFSFAMTLSVALAVPGSGSGAVKADLLDYNGDYTPCPPDPVVVGTFNVNTTASGELRVVVNLSSAEEAADMEDLPVRVVIRKQTPCIPSQINTNFPDAISTNKQGQGNATLKVDISDIYACDPAIDSIDVMVFVNLGGSPDMFEGAANLVVPLK